MPDRQFEQPHLAEVYDHFCPWDPRGDFGFYLPLLMGAESVLDVGCGTGRARPANAEEVDTPAGRVRMAHEVNSVEGEIVRFMTTYTRLRLGRARGEQYGDWDRSPLTEQSPEIITLARR